MGQRLFVDNVGAVLEYDETVSRLDDVLPGKLNPNGTKLLKWLIAKDPKGRLTAEEALSHAWFR